MKEKTAALLQGTLTKDAIDEIIKLNEGLVGAQLKKFNLTYDPDAISFAYEALFIAIKTYDPNKSSSFSTYATVCIYNKLGSYIRSMHTQILLNTISYDNKIGIEDASYIEGIACPKSLEFILANSIYIEDAIKAVEECREDLQNPVHQKIIKIWREEGFCITFNELARRVGCSQSYVSQVINKFRKKLKRKLEG